MKKSIRSTMKTGILLPLLAAVLASGCATPTQRIDLSHDTSAEVNALDSRDFDIAAEKMIEDMIASGAVDKPAGGRYVLAIGRVANRSGQDIDVDQLVKKIRVALLKSGKVVVTTAVAAGGAEDDMSRAVRDLADDDMFNSATVAKAGTAIAPELSLTGKIIGRNMKISSSKQRIEYIFQLSLTDINTGLAFWEGEETIGKIGAR
jgi:hypothetical protein